MKKIFTVSGMSCNHCVNHVKNAVAELEGVKSAQVSLEKKELVAEFDELKTSVESIIAAVEAEGYECLASQ